MMIRLISLNESLEDKRKQLSEHLQRPVYISSKSGTSAFKAGCRYITPDGKYISRLDFFLSCYEIDYMNPDLKQNDKEYKLTESTVVSLLYPLNNKEKVRWDNNPFSLVGLAYNTSSVFYINKNDIIPDELKPFVVKYKRPRAAKFVDVIAFACSHMILRPEIRQPRWHLGSDIEDNIKYTTIHPPGYYNEGENKINYVAGWNHYCLMEQDPGLCVVCHGSSNERKHIGILAYGGTWYPTNLICKRCFKPAMEEINSLMEC